MTDRTRRDLEDLISPLGWVIDGKTSRTGHKLRHPATGAQCSAPRSPTGEAWKTSLVPRLRRATSAAAARREAERKRRPESRA